LLRACCFLRKGACFAGIQKRLCVETPEQLDHFCYQASPAGLMARSETSAVISVEIFVEQNVVFPVRIGLKFLCSTVDRSTARPIAQKDPGQSIGNFPLSYNWGNP
jgi:hypothetical protein